MTHKTSVSNPIYTIPKEPKRNDHTEPKGKKFQCMEPGCDFECNTSWALGRHFKTMLENNEQHRTIVQQHEHAAYKERLAKEKRNKTQREYREEKRNKELQQTLDKLRDENRDLRSLEGNRQIQREMGITPKKPKPTKMEQTFGKSQKFCTNCGDKLQENHNYCGICGVSLP